MTVQPDLALQVEFHTLASPSKGYVASLLSRDFKATSHAMGKVLSNLKRVKLNFLLLTELLSQVVDHLRISPFLAKALQKAIKITPGN